MKLPCLALVGVIFGSIALDGCSTATPLVSEWRNPAQASGAFRRVMVGGPTGNLSIRRNFEDEFVGQLAGLGVEALPSYRYLAENEEPNENNLKEAARKARADGVLFMRSVKAEEKTRYPAIGPEISFGIFGSNAAAEWTGVPGGSGPYRYREYTSESALYGVATNELVWTGTVRTSDPGNVPTAIKSYVQTVTNALAAQNLFPKK